MRPPRVSVCIPTYNGASFLRRCLDSVLDQEGVELQVLVGDAASTDDTRGVAADRPDPRVRVIENEQRLGLAGNWRRTWEQADGDYVALVGQDDWLAPGWAASLSGLLQRHPDASLAFGRRRFEFADEESRKVVGDFFENRYPEMLAPFHAAIEERIPATQMIEEAMRFCFEINLIGEPSFVLVRRDHPASREGFDASMKQMIDWEFYTRFFVDRPIVQTTEVVGTYHIHARASSIENSPLSRHYREYDAMLDTLRDRFAGQLRPEQAERLHQRQEEVKGLAVEWEQKEREAAS